MFLSLMLFNEMSLEKNMYIIREKNTRQNMFYFLLKIMVCILVVFCIHTIWQTVQENYVRPKIKNTNAEIEKYKAIVESMSRQNKYISQKSEGEEADRCILPETNMDMDPVSSTTDIESDLNSFLDSILIENHIEIMPVI